MGVGCFYLYREFFKFFDQIPPCGSSPKIQLGEVKSKVIKERKPQGYMSVEEGKWG